MLSFHFKLWANYNDIWENGMRFKHSLMGYLKGEEVIKDKYKITVFSRP